MKNKSVVAFIAAILIIIVIVIVLLITQGKQNEENEKQYISTDPEQCKVIKFLCTQGKQPFFEDKGCGCEPITEDEKVFCPQQQAEFCTEIYQPVCGWFDPDKIQCIKYPCAQTFSNSCYACRSERVEYWTEGECPQ